MTFFEELSAVFDQLAMYQCPVVVCGDFNVHVDVHDDTHAVHLAQLLQCYDLVQQHSQHTETVTLWISSSPGMTRPSVTYESAVSSLITHLFISVCA